MECLKLVSTQTRVLSLEPVKHGSKPDRHWCEASEEQRARPPSLALLPSSHTHNDRTHNWKATSLARSLDSGAVATRRRQWRCRVQPCLPPSLPPSPPSSSTASRSLVWFSRPTGASRRQRRRRRRQRGPHEVWSIKDAFHVSIEPNLPMLWLSLIGQEHNDCY